MSDQLSSPIPTGYISLIGEVSSVETRSSEEESDVSSQEPEIEETSESESNSSRSSDESTMASDDEGTTPTTKKTIKVGDEEIEISSSKRTVDTGMTTLYRKADRDSLKKENKLNDLFERATKTRIQKLDLVTLTLSEEDKLDDTYNLGIQIGKIKSHFMRYDMHDVMGIVQFGAGGLSDPTAKSDIFAYYSIMSEEEVAKSNKWYNEFTVQDYYRQNLNLTFEFLENNTTAALWEKCLEVYEEYEPEEKGGPLMFLIIMHKLQNHTDAAVQYLLNSVKNMKITNFEGENVSRVSSLIRGAYKRLKLVSSTHEDLPKWVLQVFQTSTVTEFNQAFAHIQRDVEVVKPLLTKKPAEYPTIEDMVKMAEKLYLNLASTNMWTGIQHKVNPSSFPALNGMLKTGLSCWNCGQAGHSLKDCPKPKNNDLIEQRKKQFKEAKKKEKKDGKGKGENRTSKAKGKWAPPTESEKNRRIIDGKPMFYLNKTKRWVDDKKAMPQAANPAVQAPAPSNASSSGSTIGSSDTNKQVKELVISNATHQFNVAMQAAVNQLLEV